jgi:adenosylcobinamide kinase/adenosylcobinamide-phosphate guanylyltransferase
MKELIFITGGQRSGKSSFGQKLAEELSDQPLYLATARAWDEDFRARIDRHRSDRGDHWSTLEEEVKLGSLEITGKTVLLDCITLWLTNLYHDNQFEAEATLQKAKREWDELSAKEATLIVISNELGMGVHAENEPSRKFVDLQGWMNQHIAHRADQVYFMVSGIPQKIK